MDGTKSLPLKKQAKSTSRKIAATPQRLGSFGDYYFSMFLKPRRTFDALMADPRRLKFGSIAVLIPALLYTLFYFMAAAAGGAPSAFKPWLAVPSEVYFHFNRFVVAPSMIMCWILAAAVAQLLSRLFSGKGSFEDNLSVFGFGISIASWSLLVHDLTDAFLGFVGVIDIREYEVALNTPTIWRTLFWCLAGLYFAWYMLLFSKGIGSAQRLRRGPAVFVGITAFILYQFVFLIFNR
jgi:hypothetical protein